MRIWVINYYIAPPTRAGNTRHHQLAQALIARGHDVVLIGASRHHLAFKIAEQKTVSEPETIEEVPYFWIRTPLRGGRRVARFLNWLIFSLRGFRSLRRAALPKPDVVIGSSPQPFAAYLAFRMARFFSVPFVYEVRDLWPLTLELLGKYPTWHPVIGAIALVNDRLTRRASLIVTLFSGAEEYIRAQTDSDLTIVCVPNAVDRRILDGFHQDPGGGERPLVVMYAGNHGFANALESILDCCRFLNDLGHQDEFVFRFVGDGPEKARLKRRASELGLVNARFEEPVPKTLVHRRLAEADILIATLKDSPLYRHGISLNKLFDYLGAGRPIVFGGEAANDQVRDSGAGIVVPPEDPEAMAQALLEIRRLPASERARMGRLGREYAARSCTIEQRALELESSLMKVLS